MMVKYLLVKSSDGTIVAIENNAGKACVSSIEMLSKSKDDIMTIPIESNITCKIGDKFSCDMFARYCTANNITTGKFVELFKLFNSMEESERNDIMNDNKYIGSDENSYHDLDYNPGDEDSDWN